MTEIEKTKKEIEVLTAKLTLLEEIEKHKSPAEEAFKKVYNRYPMTDVNDTCWDGSTWIDFKFGYNAAQEDYKVGDYQPTPQEPEERIHKEVENEIGKLQENNWYVDAKTLIKSNWEPTLQPSMTCCMIEGPPPNGYPSWSEWFSEMGSKGILHNLRISSLGEGKFQPTPQTENEVAEGLRSAFREAQQTEEWKETQKLIDEEDNGKNFKNSIDLIREWGEKNKPKTLYQICMEWWDEVFVNEMDDDICIDVLVSRIDKEFIPPSYDRNGYEWEKCLKMMRDKLR